eukprot:jgi/Psemu1/325309/estExt_fgenesh1_pg.C_2250004
MSLLTEEWWVDFVAGWMSGAVGVVACQPLDTVLTRFQAGQITTAASAGELAMTTSRSSSVTVSAVHNNVRGLVQNFGLRSLWRGASPMIGAVPIQNALLMGGYGFGKRYSENTHAVTKGSSSSSSYNNTLFPIFVGGCVGGVLQSFLMSPVEWIKVNQQTAVDRAATSTASSSSSSLSAVLQKFLQNKHRLWNRGLTATVLRDGIPHGVWFASYEYCKLQMLATTFTSISGENRESLPTTIPVPGQDSSSSSSSSSSFYKTVTVPVVSGAFAATVAWAVGYPFDIIKTRIQATTQSNIGSKNILDSAPGVYETGRQLVQEANGNVVKGLYRGFGLKLVRSIPASMIGFFTYEFVASSLTSSSNSNN